MDTPTSSYTVLMVDALLSSISGFLSANNSNHRQSYHHHKTKISPEEKGRIFGHLIC